MRLKHSEDSIQTAFFNWCLANNRLVPELDLMFSVPNGAYKSKASARKFKQTGLRAGVPDVMFPVARCGFNGMFIEFKSDTGRVSTAQKWWIENLRKQGYLVTTCRKSDLAAEMVMAYLRGKRDKVISMIQDK